jgi:hypothetical protein
MMIPDAHLSYEHHIAPFRMQGYLIGEPKKDAYWHHRAQYIHALSVCQATLDLFLQMQTIIGSAQPPEFYHFMMFGVARRYKSLWSCLRTIIFKVPPERNEPMTTDEVEEIARLLNAAYIDIRGVQDNYAWALLHLAGRELIKKIDPYRVSLFGKELLDAKQFAFLVDLQKEFKDWNKTLKQRRDPVAHRIPLTMPPSFLNEQDVIRRRELETKWGEASTRVLSLLSTNAPGNDVEKAEAEQEELHIALQRVGSFAPYFGHDPDSGFEPLYSTIPEDIGMLVKLSRRINAHIVRIRETIE